MCRQPNKTGDVFPSRRLFHRSYSGNAVRILVAPIVEGRRPQPVLLFPPPRFVLFLEQRGLLLQLLCQFVGVGGVELKVKVEIEETELSAMD